MKKQWKPHSCLWYVSHSYPNYILNKHIRLRLLESYTDITEISGHVMKALHFSQRFRTNFFGSHTLVLRCDVWTHDVLVLPFLSDLTVKLLLFSCSCPLFSCHPTYSFTTYSRIFKIWSKYLFIKSESNHLLMHLC